SSLLIFLHVHMVLYLLLCSMVLFPILLLHFLHFYNLLCRNLPYINHVVMLLLLMFLHLFVVCEILLFLSIFHILYNYVLLNPFCMHHGILYLLVLHNNLIFPKIPLILAFLVCLSYLIILLLFLSFYSSLYFLYFLRREL